MIREMLVLIKKANRNSPFDVLIDVNESQGHVLFCGQTILRVAASLGGPIFINALQATKEFQRSDYIEAMNYIEEKMEEAAKVSFKHAGAFLTLTQDEAKKSISNRENGYTVSFEGEMYTISYCGGEFNCTNRGKTSQFSSVNALRCFMGMPEKIF